MGKYDKSQWAFEMDERGAQNGPQRSAQTQRVPIAEKAFQRYDTKNGFHVTGTPRTI
jgi:hypothetical protein